MEIRMGTKVFCTEDYDDNNTGGKLGRILDIWGSYYNIGFFNKLKMSNGDEMRYVDKYPDVKSTWWVRNYLIKSSVTKNKFK